MRGLMILSNFSSQQRQEYEGRAEDITIFPWVKHLSVLSSFSHIIKVR